MRNATPFADLLEPLQRLRRSLLRETGGDRLMAKVLALGPGAGLDAVLVAVELRGRVPRRQGASTVAGRDSQPLEDSAFSRRIEMSG